MKHLTSPVDDVPPAPVLFDRRRRPSRRAAWRGGRRDSDWQDRPPGAWSRLREPAGRLVRLRRALSALPLAW